IPTGEILTFSDSCLIQVIAMQVEQYMLISYQITDTALDPLSKLKIKLNFILKLSCEYGE
ncbi:hypothetical protein ACTLKF_003804, partial [Providencia stuartii]